MTLKERLGLAQEPVYLVDGSSFLYRGFYAYPDLKRSDGFPTNAIFIVLRILTRLLREEKPEFLGFFLDGKGPNFRHELYPEYKANRPRMPEDLAAQIEPLKQGVELLGLRLEVPDGFEADDRIASLAAAFSAERPVVIVGSDKDLKQCLSPRVFLWDPGAKKDAVTTEADFRAETGLSPDQWPDFQALSGDSADNIPGVPGIGPKTAFALMKDFPRLEDVRDRVPDLPPSPRKKIEPMMDKLFLFRELTRLRQDAAPGAVLPDYAVRPGDRAALLDYLNVYEFRSLAREWASAPGAGGLAGGPAGGPAPGAGGVGRPAASGGGGKGKAKAPAQLSLFDAAPLAAVPAGPVPDLRRVDSAAALPDPAGQVVGLVPLERGFQLGLAGEDWVVELAPAEDASSGLTRLARELADRLAPADRIAVAGLKALLAGQGAWAALPLSLWFDCSLAAYLLAPEDRNYGLERLVSSLALDPEAPAVPPGAPGLALAALAGVQERRLAAAGLDRLVRELELPLVPVLVDMERAGVRIDAVAFASYLEEVGGQLDALTRDILALAGEDFNIRSSQQLARILFDKLGLKPSGKTEGGALSTSVEALEKLAGKHDIIDKILEFRTLEKLRSTYLEPLPKLADAQGRVHTSFNQLATATGRLSSSGPNLQNIPIRGPQGGRMRACFIAAPDCLLAGADYSQIELRVLAHFSADPALVQAFEQGVDIHARTASLLLDKEPGAVTADERRNAKTVNFGLIYGMGPQKLARELNLSLAEAKGFIERYFAKLSKLKEFYDRTVEDALERGYVTTLAGRRRLLPELNSRNQNLAAQARRQAINTVIQGSAADIIKLAMLAVHGDAALRELGARLVLQVHDELLLEAPQAQAQKAGERLAELMQGVVRLAVPLKVDLAVGRNWSLAH
jgi:DNA polymerase-1